MISLNKFKKTFLNKGTSVEGSEDPETIDRLINDPRDPYSILSLFTVVKPEEIERAINLKQQAIELGKRNLPSRDTTNRFGTAEVAIDTEAQRIVTRYHAKAVAKIQHLSSSIQTECRLVSQKISDTRLLPQKFNQDMNTYLDNNATDYEEIKGDYQKVKSEITQFMSQNGIDRPAEIRTFAEKMFHWSIFAFMIVIEVALNCTLFATNLEGGLLEGIKIAVFASLLNIGVAGCFGHFLVRYKNLGSIAKKIIGWSFLFVSLCVTITVGLAVAHFRDALQIPLDELGGTTYQAYALQTFIASPFELADLYSWILFALTLFCGIAACADGYRMDDPCPGYSALYSKYRKIADEWSDLLEERRDHLVEIQQNSIKELGSNVIYCDKGIVTINSYKQDLAQTEKSYEAALRSVDKAFQSLVSLFRSTNSQYRTEPVPDYFREEVSLDLSQLPPIHAVTHEVEVQEIISAVDQLKNEVDQIRSEIMAVFNEQEAKIRFEKEKLDV